MKKESSKKLAPSSQTSKEENKALFFQQDELENQETSIITALLPIWTTKIPNPTQRKKHDFQNCPIYYKWKAVDWHLDERMEQVEFKKIEVGYRIDYQGKLVFVQYDSNTRKQISTLEWSDQRQGQDLDRDLKRKHQVGCFR